MSGNIKAPKAIQDFRARISMLGVLAIFVSNRVCLTSKYGKSDESVRP